MSLGVGIQNLYVDREITGEAFLQPYKTSKQFIHKTLQGDNCLSKTTRLVAQIAISLFLSPFVIIGMIVKCLNSYQVKAYNEKIKQKVLNRESLRDYPGQPDSFLRLDKRIVLARLDQANKRWERCACNILGHGKDNEVFIQFLERNPRWKIPKGVIRPFAF